MRGLTLIVAGADPRRFHAALAMAAASAATGAATRVYLHGDAVLLLVPPLRSPDDDRHRMSGLPTLAQILDEALELGVHMICCQSGLAMADIAADSFDARIETGGLVGLMGALGDDRLVTV
jgi:predicted peroxiredoxin